jgi:hypothetical protein
MAYAMDTGCRWKMRRQVDSAKEFFLTCVGFEVPS